MVFIPIGYFRGTEPLPAYVSPGNARAAQALYEAIAQAAPRNPLPFVGNPLTPTNDPYSFAPIARDAWENWLGVELPVVPEADPPDYPSGMLLRFGVVTKWRHKESGNFEYDKRGLLADPPNTEAYLWGPIQRGAHRYSFPGPPSSGTAVTARNSPAGPVEVIPVSSGRLDELYDYYGADAFVAVPVDPEEDQRYAPMPMYVPGVAPSTVPNIVPVTPQIDEPQRIYPVPVQVPGFLPTPSRLPNQPIPFIPGTPENPDRTSPLPPMWVTPDGIEVGSPGGSQMTTPRAGGLPGPRTQEQEEYERDRLPPPICIPDFDPPEDCCDCDDIREIVKEELDSKFPPSRPNINQTASFVAANSRCVFLPEFTYKVRIEVTEYPANTRTQSGGEDAPDVFYFGWYAFGEDSSGGDRHPIHYEESVLFPPSGARSMCYTMYDGCKATVTVYYKQELS